VSGLWPLFQRPYATSGELRRARRLTLRFLKLMTVLPDDVRRVLPETELSDAELNAEIDTARRAYEQRIDGEPVDEGPKDDVVTRLSAHLIASGPERQVDSAGESGGNVSFAGETGEGLAATTHGQMAVLLDPTGQLDGGQDGASDDFTLST